MIQSSQCEVQDAGLSLKLSYDDAVDVLSSSSIERAIDLGHSQMSVVTTSAGRRGVLLVSAVGDCGLMFVG